MQNKSASHDFLIGGIYGAIAAIFFSIILIIFNAQFLKTHWLNFIIAYIFCFIVALFLVHITSK